MSKSAMKAATDAAQTKGKTLWTTPADPSNQVLADSVQGSSVVLARTVIQESRRKIADLVRPFTAMVSAETLNKSIG